MPTGAGALATFGTMTDAEPHAAHLQPGQVVTVFRSRLAEGRTSDDGYGPMAARMVELGTAMPGFVDFKTFTADDGERVALITFADAESQAAWRHQVEHARAQKAGRDQFYAEYSLQVCTCDRVSTYRADAAD